MVWSGSGGVGVARLDGLAVGAWPHGPAMCSDTRYFPMCAVVPADEVSVTAYVYVCATMCR